MRFVLLLLISNLFTEPVFPQISKSASVSITGVVKNMKPGDSVLMIYLYKQLITDNKDIVIDSVVPDKNREFMLNKKLEEPGYYRIGYKGLKSGSSVLLLLDAGTHNAKISIDTVIVRSDGVEPFIANKIYVKGIKDNDLLDSFFNTVSYYYKNYESPINKRMIALEEKEDNNSELDSLNTVLKKIGIAKQAKLNEIVDKQMGVSIAIYQTMTQWDNSNFEFMNKMLKKFNTEKSSSFITPLIEEKVVYLKSVSLINKPVIPFTLINENGQSVNIADYVGKKVILIDFWASWCGPCLAEMPGYHKIYEKYNDKGFIVLGISTDSNKESWKRALIKQNLAWVNIVDEKGKNSVAKKYGVSYMPSNFLVDKDGKIIKRDIKPVELEEYLKANNL